jgi:hypothetical protein
MLFFDDMYLDFIVRQVATDSIDVRFSIADNPGGIPGHDRALGNVLRNNRSRANYSMIANANPRQN